MFDRQLPKILEFVRAKAAVAAGTTDQTSSWIDTANCEGVMFAVVFGAITSGAVTSIKAQQAQISDGTGAADLEGTAIPVADTDDDKIFLLDVYRPRERYVACVVDRGTQNAVIDAIIAIPYGAKVVPVTQGSTVGGSECHVSPAEGTA